MAMTSLGVSTATQPDDSPCCQVSVGLCYFRSVVCPGCCCQLFFLTRMGYLGCCPQPVLNFVLLSKCKWESASGSAQDQVWAVSPQESPQCQLPGREGTDVCSRAICMRSVQGHKATSLGWVQNLTISQTREEERRERSRGRRVWGSTSFYMWSCLNKILIKE